MSFPRYDKYKPVGLPWLAEVPNHWDVSPIRRLCVINKRIAGELGLDILSITQGGIRIKDTESNDGQLSMDYSKYQLVEPGDFAMNHMDLLTGYVDISKYHGVTSPDYRVFSLKDATQASDRYLLYLLQMGYRNKLFFPYGQGSSQLGRWRLPTDEFQNFLFPLPPLHEQNAIVALLDHETAKIDGLIAEQRRLIDLLKEKRQAVISSAVTKGVNPNARAKQSGVPLFGAIPAHWCVCAVRRAVTGVEQGWSPECLAFPAEESEWGILKTGCVNGGIFNETDNKALPPQIAPMAEYEVMAGDVLMSRANGSPALVGSTAFVEATRAKLMLSDKIFRLRLAADVDPRFFVAAFNSWAIRVQIERALSGGKGLANNLPQASLKEFLLCLPPLEEQVEICVFLAKELQKIDDLLREAEASVTLLLERRSALISAAVTGQIDVRGTTSTSAVAEGWNTVHATVGSFADQHSTL